MPHLVKVQKKYESKGFVILAIHRQSGSLKGKVLALAQSKGINYTITQSGSVRGETARGIPRAYLFDWTGKCIWEGHPSQMDGPIDAAMSKAPHWLTRGRQFKSKKVRSLATKLFSNRGFGTLAKSLGTLSEKGEGDTKEEATFLRENILRYGNGLLSKAQGMEKSDAIEALKLYAKAAGQFKGTEIGEKASQRQRELKSDKEFQKELRAAKILARIEFWAGKLKPGGTTKRSNLQWINAIRGAAATLQKKYPTTAANQKAQAIVSGIR